MTHATDERRQRLHDLIDLARATRGLTRAELGKALGRDPTKVYPESGNPKTDFLVSLAGILEWPVGDVVEFIWQGESGPMSAAAVTGVSSNGARRGGQQPDPADESFEALFEVARHNHKAGDYRTMVATAKRMYDLAENEDRRAFACAMEASAWDGLGRYTQEVDACRRGLSHKGVSCYTRNILRADLANAWYCLWDLTPALGTATFLLEHYEANPPKRRLDEKRPTFVRYVRGHTRRRLANTEPDLALDHYRLAVADLSRAQADYVRLAEELGDRALLGIASTCKGGMDECLVELGELSPRDAVNEALELATAGPESDGHELTGDEVESIGWRCVFASNITLRHLTGRDLQDAMRVLTTRALDAAEQLNNWAMRERCFTIQLNLHRTLTDTTGLDLPLTIDPHERTLITQAMGRFPGFRSIGWDLLSRATIVERKGGAA